MSQQRCPGERGTFSRCHWQLLTQTLLLLPGGESAPLTLRFTVIVPRVPELPENIGKPQEAVTSQLGRCHPMWEEKNHV